MIRGFFAIVGEGQARLKYIASKSVAENGQRLGSQGCKKSKGIAEYKLVDQKADDRYTAKDCEASPGE